MVCSAFAWRIIEDVIKIEGMAEGQLACVGAGACTARRRVVSRMPETRSALVAEMASLGRASDVNIHSHLDSDRVSSPTSIVLSSSTPSHIAIIRVVLSILNMRSSQHDIRVDRTELATATNDEWKTGCLK